MNLQERSLDPRLAGGRKREEIITPDPDRLGAERESLEHMGAALDAAIDHHIDPIANGIDDFRQLIEAAA